MYTQIDVYDIDRQIDIDIDMCVYLCEAARDGDGHSALLFERSHGEIVNVYMYMYIYTQVDRYDVDRFRDMYVR